MGCIGVWLLLSALSPQEKQEPSTSKDGVVRIEVQGRVRMTRVRPDSGNFEPPWRADLLGACDGPEKPLEDALGGILKTLEKGKGPSVRRTDRPRITLDLNEVTAKRLFAALSEKAGVEIRLTPEIREPISVTARAVPWDRLLCLVSDMLGLVAAETAGSVVRVFHPDHYPRDWETRVYRLRYVFPPGFWDPPRREEDSVFPARRICAALLTRDPSGRDVGKLDFDLATSSFVVTDARTALDRIGKVLEVMDEEPAQVLLDIKIFVTSNREWLAFLGNEAAPMPGVSKLPFGRVVPKKKDTPAGMRLADLKMLLRAMKADPLTKLVQEPELLALDGADAVIFVDLTSGVPGANRSPLQIGIQFGLVARVDQDAERVDVTAVLYGGTTNHFGSPDRSPLLGETGRGSPPDGPVLSRLRPMRPITWTGLLEGRTIGLYTRALPRVNDMHCLVFVTPRIVPRDASDGGRTESLQDLLRVRDRAGAPK